MDDEFEKNELVNKVDFSVPLSGSNLFDLHSIVTAKNICVMFPGLSYEVTRDSVRVYGMLNGYWFKEFNKAVFSIGEIKW